jgi:prephenate dehydrogenase
MHILAVAVCETPICTGAGALRAAPSGLHPGAALDVPLWTQLFSLNAPALAAVIERLEGHLKAYREVLARGDRNALAEKLRQSSARKRA